MTSKLTKPVVILATGLLLVVCQAHGQSWYVTGQVAMEDGSPPPKPVTIERYCGGTRIIREAMTDRKGRFQMRLMEVDGRASVSFNSIPNALFRAGDRCVLRASLSGYQSSIIDLTGRRPTDDRNLPPIVLRRPHPETAFSLEAGPGVPKAARKAWDRAMKAVDAQNWAEAERQLRPALQAHPQFTQGWHLLGSVCQNQKKVEEARQGYERAIESDPRSLGP